ncbi:MAG TPA: Ig-like domain-containing protein, partial [Acidimicrobiales bacterium]|nr:Ig-like domain-containing protein [Acidimicrobiales bacterium]
MFQARSGVPGGRIVAALVSSAMLMTGFGQGSAQADATAVKGSAYGFYGSVSLFRGPPTSKGPTPTVTLAPDASNSPQTATEPSARFDVGPATIFSSGPLDVSTAGRTGPNGSVTSSTNVLKVNASGQETFTAASLASSCTASETAVSGSTTINTGTLQVDNGDEDPTNATPDHPPVDVTLPARPAPNTTYEGHLHIGNTTDTFRWVFNEQVVNADSITVDAAHLFLIGPTAVGELIVGQSTCGLTSTAPNAAPVALADAFSTAEDTPLTVAAPGVLGNDTDPDGDPLTASKAPAQSAGLVHTFPGEPPNGSATLNPDGSFTYTPDPNFFGTDTFTYLARDARGANATGLITITVTPVPDAPVAGDDAYDAEEDTPLTVAAPGVLANDTDADPGTILSAGSASDPANGTVTLNADGSFTYAPDANFLGTDTFTYEVSDGTGLSDTGLVTIVVTLDEALMLRDINAGTGDSSPVRYTAVGNTVFFAATNGSVAPANGIELWKSDGTAEGTVLVKDINPGTASSNPDNLRALGNTLFFTATNGSLTGANGTELWKSDGTAEGTVLVKDIFSGPGSSNPANLTAV